MSVLAYAGVIAIAAPLTVQPARDIVAWARLVSGIDSRSQFYAQFTQEEFSAADEIAAAEYIRSHTNPTDRIAMFGYDGVTLYLAGRPIVSRFVFALPMVGVRSSPATRDRYRREFLDALRDPPEYVIVGFLLLGNNRSVEVFPELVEYLNRGYVLERSFGVIDLYRLDHHRSAADRAADRR